MAGTPLQDKVMMGKETPALHICTTKMTPWKQVMLVYSHKLLNDEHFPGASNRHSLGGSLI